MKNYVISSDSTCDLSNVQLDQYDIQVLPLTIILGGKDYRDNVDITSVKMLEYVNNGGDMPKTSAISIGEYQEFFRKCVDEGKQVIHFCISEELSSCYSNACLAAREFDGKVFVVNSRQLSSGQGLLVMKAGDMLAEGKTIEETYEAILPLTEHVNTSFLLDTLTYLHKGGRCSLAALLGAKMMKIHPCLSMRGGLLKVKRKYPGKLLVCYKRYITELAQEFGGYDKKRCFITHCQADKEIVDLAKQLVKDLFEFEEINEAEAGTTVSCHCGKNTLGVLFITD